MGDSGGGSVVGSPVNGEAQGQVAFTVQYVSTSEERNMGKLLVNIQVNTLFYIQDIQVSCIL